MNLRVNTHPRGHLILKSAYYLVGGLARAQALANINEAEG